MPNCKFRHHPVSSGRRPHHVHVWNAIFEILLGHRLEAQGSVKWLKVALRRQGDRFARITSLAFRHCFPHQGIAQTLATVIRRYDDAADARMVITFGPPETSARQEVISVEQAQVTAIRVMAVEFGVGAVLLHHEYVDAHFQHGVKIECGELLEPPHIDRIAGTGGQ